jgi:Raf kinase inhibitor-like YbhB/YbcL family protein
MFKKVVPALLALILLTALSLSGCSSTGNVTAMPTSEKPTTTTTTAVVTTAVVTTTTTVATTTPVTSTTAATTTITKTVTPTTTTIIVTPSPTATTTAPLPTTTAVVTTTPVEPTVFTLTSTAFTEGQPIPRIHGYYRGNKSPELDWTGKPQGTVSFVLIMEDPDGGDWSHWVIFNLGADIEGLGEDQPKLATLGDNVKQGTNDFGEIGYGGPAPPSGVHHYYFRLYALDTTLTLPGGASRTQVRNAMQGHILDEATLMGTFTP